MYVQVLQIHIKPQLTGRKNRGKPLESDFVVKLVGHFQPFQVMPRPQKQPALLIRQGSELVEVVPTVDRAGIIQSH